MKIETWLGLACAFAAIPAAWAHAVLQESAPAAGAAVTGPTVPLALRFNSRIDAKRSRLTLACPGTAESAVPLGPQSAPDRIAASVTVSTPGNCTVHWQVLATDGHITRGTFSFQVK